MLVGEEIFNVADGYDEEMWDDTALIRNYEKAYEASRSAILHTPTDQIYFSNFL